VSAVAAILADLITLDPELNADKKLQEFCSMALLDDFFIYSNTDFDTSKIIFLFLRV
jgi:hypothetical protein